MPYTIKEMSELTGLPASTLRYYDKQGLLPNLRRDQNNRRIFSEDDYRMLRLIDCLKRSGLSIKDIRHFINLTGHGNIALAERLDIFRNRRELLKQEMADLQEVLSIIEYKCWYYEQACTLGDESAITDADVPEKFRKARAHLRGHID